MVQYSASLSGSFNLDYFISTAFVNTAIFFCDLQSLVASIVSVLLFFISY